MEMIKGCRTGFIVTILCVMFCFIFAFVPETYAQPSGIESEIGDFVWNDLNQNGIQDAGEPGVQDILVTLIGSSLPPVTTLTDSDGLYSFIYNFNGNVQYFLEFTLPNSSWYFSPSLQGSDTAKDSDVISISSLTGTTDQIVVPDGATNLTFDAGIYTDSTQNPVPEPATMLLLASGLVGLVGLRKKFKKN